MKVSSWTCGNPRKPRTERLPRAVFTPSNLKQTILQTPPRPALPRPGQRGAVAQIRNRHSRPLAPVNQPLQNGGRKTGQLVISRPVLKGKNQRGIDPGLRKPVPAARRAAQLAASPTDAAAARRSPSCTRQSGAVWPVIGGGANMFFRLVNARYVKGALILTSNRGLDPCDQTIRASCEA